MKLTRGRCVVGLLRSPYTAGSGQGFFDRATTRGRLVVRCRCVQSAPAGGTATPTAWSAEFAAPHGRRRRRDEVVSGRGSTTAAERPERREEDTPAAPGPSEPGGGSDTHFDACGGAHVRAEPSLSHWWGGRVSRELAGAEGRGLVCTATDAVRVQEWENSGVSESGLVEWINVRVC